MTTRAHHVAVIDIGKTNAKLALVDRTTLEELTCLTTPNTVRPGPPWPHFDLDGHWAFLTAALAQTHAEHGVDAISITAHGASIVLLDADGALAAPMLDYEHPGPNALAADYAALRPVFEDTGSPHLAGGLNVGAQLHYMFAQDPELRARTAQILTYPQYWAYRLTGVAATELTSLGCHTDLWLPRERRPSDLVKHLAIDKKLASVRNAFDVLGTVLPEVAQQTGLSPDTPVSCGLHDSNASLLPHLLSRTAPFSVVSTGTWIIAMTIGGKDVHLQAERDTLLNVHALGDPVPSARFMGGREFDIACGATRCEPSEDAIAKVLSEGIMLRPSLAPGTGPFKGREGGWGPGGALKDADLTYVATSFYCALVTATCLELTGHRGEIVVEGPFARNRQYLEMLSVVSGSTVVSAPGQTGTSQGAALLVDGPPREAVTGTAITPNDGSADMAAYAKAWRRDL